MLASKKIAIYLILAALAGEFQSFSTVFPLNISRERMLLEVCGYLFFLL